MYTAGQEISTNVGKIFIVSVTDEKIWWQVVMDCRLKEVKERIDSFQQFMDMLDIEPAV